MPVSRLIGQREFWGLPFMRCRRPRSTPGPKSETVVEAVLRHTGDRSAPLALFDIGVGTGCLLLSLLTELPNASGSGSDISAAAIDTARANARSLGLAERARFAAGDGFAGLEGPVRLGRRQSALHPGGGHRRGWSPRSATTIPALRWTAAPDGLDAFRRFAPGHCRPSGAGRQGGGGVRRGAGRRRSGDISPTPAWTVWRRPRTSPDSCGFSSRNRGEIALAGREALCYDGWAFAGPGTRFIWVSQIKGEAASAS